MKILQNEVLWINYIKLVHLSPIPSRNAFDVLRGASDGKRLPEKIKNPINEKAVLFNDIIDNFEADGIFFPLPYCSRREKNKITGVATEMIYEMTSSIWKIGQCESQLKSSNLWSKIPDKILSLANFSKLLFFF